VRIAAVILGLSLGTVLAMSAPALAHDDQGVLAGEYVADPADAPSGTYRVRLTFLNDGHPAEGATVTMTAVAGAGGTVPATPMSPVDVGEYETAVAFPNPGVWTVTVVADAPAATFEQAVTIAEPAREPSFEDSAAEEPVDEAEAIAGSEDDGGGGGSSSTGLVIAIVAAVLAVAAGAAVVIWRRRAAAA
jgi:hypothetical protein